MMNNEKHIDLIAAYLNGSITPDERAELNELIDAGEIDPLHVNELESTYTRLGSIPAPGPRPEVRDRFYAMLAEEQEKEQQSAHSYTIAVTDWLHRFRTELTLRRAAFALGIFLVGLLIGNWTTPFQNYRGELSELSTEVSQMREVMMMSLLDDNSATERLKAVNISSDIRSADARMTRALLRTLNNDPNVNVRLAAVEALLHHASAPDVREGLIASIRQQESPLVQAALADAMLVLQEEQSIREFQQLLEENSLDPGVRDKLENTIAALS